MKVFSITILFLFVFYLNSIAQLSGTYTIGGSGANYSSIGAAISALTTSGVNGPVIFNINSGTYTEQISIGNITGTSSVNTVTFKSTNNDSSSVIITSPNGATATNNHLIKLTNSHHIIFKSITLQRTGSTLYAMVLELFGSSTHITISNCILKNDLTNEPSYDVGLIRSDNSNVNNNSEYIKISNNRFVNGSCAINLQGLSSTSADLSDSIKITNNIFVNQRRASIAIKFSNAPDIISNIINSTSDYYDYKGMDFQYCMNGMRVINNSLYLNTKYGIYMQNSMGSGSLAGLVSNNIISMVGASTNGLYYGNSGGHNIYFNSVLTTGANSIGCFITGSTSYNIVMMNNIFANTGAGQCISIASLTNAPFTQTDFNNYYTTGTVLGMWKTTSCSNLTAWKTATGNMEVNSISSNPNYISNTNLHINTPNMSRKGTLSLSTPYLSVDVDNQQRHSLKPDLGADEFSFDNLQMAKINLDTLICQNLNLPISVKIKNVGNASIIGNIGLSYQYNGQAVVTEYKNLTNFISGDSITYIFSNNQSFSTLGYKTIKTWITWANDINKTNDTSALIVNVTPYPTVFLGNDTNICAGRSITLNAGSGFNSYLWNNNSTSQTITIDSTGIGLSGRFFRVTVTKNGCSAKDSILVRFVDCTPVETSTNNSEIKIYPNPFNEKISVHGINLKTSEVKIFTLSGGLIKEGYIISNDELNLEKLQSGVYFLHLIDGDKTIIKKIIKF